MKIQVHMAMNCNWDVAPVFLVDSTVPPKCWDLSVKINVIKI